MTRELKIGAVTWISLIDVTREDTESLGERFPEIHPLVLEELLTSTIRPRVENYDSYLYMVLHFPQFLETENKTVTQEIDFIFLPATLITIHYESLPPVDEFWHRCEEQKMANQYGKTPIHLLYYLLLRLFALTLRELDQIQTQIDIMEERIFSGREKEILEDISILKRNVLDFRRAAKPQQLTLESLVLQGAQLCGEEIKPFLNDLIGEYLKIINLLENHKEALDALYETNNSLLASKINETMRVFTVLAFISFIPALIANIYGMNLAVPFAERPGAFWGVLGLMSVGTFLVYLILKLKKLV